MKFDVDEKALKTLYTRIDKGLGDIADKILDVSQHLVVEDRGALQASGAVQHDWLRHKVYYTAPHAPFIEFGTAPHWIPMMDTATGHHTASNVGEFVSDPLADWVRRHKEKFQIGRLKRRKSGKVTRKFGKAEKAEIKAIAMAIRIKIAREGTMPKPFFQPAIAVGLIAAPRLFREAMR